ncbi:MAG: hypothetical protein GY854_33855 [Deltaproteobacteria bacterium]|nr:hypothetical protein [Deltaproteobacteria bacterium]
MTRAKDTQINKGALVEQFSSELYAGLDQGPARLELERRRLLARLNLEEDGHPARPRKTGAWFGLAAAVAVAATVTVILFVGDWNVEKASSVHTAGVQSPVPSDTTWEGEPIHVPSGTGTKVVLKDGSELWIGPLAELEMEDGRTARIRIVQGRLLARVTPTDKPESLRVMTKHATVVVHGTTFSVWADRERSIVRLHEGEIRLDAYGKSISVQPGSEVEVDAGGSITTRPISLSGALADMMIVEKVAGTEEPSIPEIDEANEESAPIRRHRSKKAARPRVRAEEPVVEEPAPLSVPDEIVVEYITGEPIQELDSQDAKPEHPAAIDEVDTVSIGIGAGGSALEQARYSRMRALIKLRRCQDVVAAASKYLAEHPESAHAEDVLYYKAYCEARIGRLAESRKLLESYLTTFPNGRHLERVYEILGE